MIKINIAKFTEGRIVERQVLIPIGTGPILGTHSSDSCEFCDSYCTSTMYANDTVDGKYKFFPCCQFCFERRVCPQFYEWTRAIFEVYCVACSMGDKDIARKIVALGFNLFD